MDCKRVALLRVGSNYLLVDHRTGFVEAKPATIGDATGYLTYNKYIRKESCRSVEVAAELWEKKEAI